MLPAYRYRRQCFPTSNSCLTTHALPSNSCHISINDKYLKKKWGHKARIWRWANCDAFSTQYPRVTSSSGHRHRGRWLTNVQHEPRAPSDLSVWLLSFLPLPCPPFRLKMPERSHVSVSSHLQQTPKSTKRSAVLYTSAWCGAVRGQKVVGRFSTCLEFEGQMEGGKCWQYL